MTSCALPFTQYCVQMSLWSAITRSNVLQGFSLTVGRSALMNACYYSNFRYVLTVNSPPLAPHWSIYTYFNTLVLTSMTGGFYTSLFVVPLDTVCSRMMNQYPILMEEYNHMYHTRLRVSPSSDINSPSNMKIRPPSHLKLFYASYFDCAVHLHLSYNGMRGLYLGFLSAWCRYSIMFGLQYLIYDMVRPVCDDSVGKITRQAHEGKSWLQEHFK